jgi:hypothetical protein
MDYAVALTSRNDVSIQWTILKIFGDDTWDHLLSAGLKVTSERWAQWQSKRGDLVVIPDLPNLSLFAHIDEGPISFTNFASLTCRVRDRLVTCQRRRREGTAGSYQHSNHRSRSTEPSDQDISGSQR